MAFILSVNWPFLYPIRRLLTQVFCIFKSVWIDKWQVFNFERDGRKYCDYIIPLLCNDGRVIERRRHMSGSRRHLKEKEKH